MVAPASVSASSVDVLLINGQATAIGTAQFELRRFMEAGGSIVIGAETVSWGNTASKLLIDHPINMLLNPLGIVTHTDRFTLTASSVLSLDATNPPAQWGNVDAGLSCLDSNCQGNSSAVCDTSVIQAAGIKAIPFLPGDIVYWSKLATVR